MLKKCSVPDELSYIKGKVHENLICQLQARQRKFEGYMSCTFPSLAVLKEISIFFQCMYDTFGYSIAIVVYKIRSVAAIICCTHYSLFDCSIKVSSLSMCSISYAAGLAQAG